MEQRITIIFRKTGLILAEVQRGLPRQEEAGVKKKSGSMKFDPLFFVLLKNLIQVFLYFLTGIRQYRPVA